MSRTVRALEFYSGIGGLHLALLRSKVNGVVVRAFDWDQTACQVYAANHSADIVTKIDISTLTASSLAPLQADLWLLSPACQPYTVLNVNSKGASDPRAKSFLHLIEHVLPELVATNAQPSRLLVENVAGFEVSRARQILLSTLRSLGYTTLELLLTPLQYGIPNSRLRYYLLAKLAPSSFSQLPDNSTNEIWRYIPGCQVWIDPRSNMTNTDITLPEYSIKEIGQYLDEEPVQKTVYPQAVPDMVLQKWGKLFDIVLPSSRRSCCFTRGYTQLVERAGSVLQMNPALDTTKTFATFLRAQSENDPQAIQILRPLHLRYFSPTELLRLFDFTTPMSDWTLNWPESVSTKTKYRLIGNSVNVRVIKELIEYLYQ